MMRYAQSDVYGKRRNPEVENIFVEKRFFLTYVQRRGTAHPQLSTKTDVSNSAVGSDPEDSYPMQPNFRVPFQIASPTKLFDEKEESQLSHWREDSVTIS